MALPFQLPVTIDFGTLPATGAGYSPQQLADRLSLNGRIFTEQAFALFVTGSTAPTSDVGPWLANGNEWRVWDSGTGAYVPISIDQGSLGYIISSTAPDPTIYHFWIETTVGGSPLALKTYYSGAWVDVYATTLAGYSTTAALTAGLAATLASANAYTDAAIAALPPPTPFAVYPAQGEGSVAQSILADGTPTKVVIDTAAINPAPAPMDTANSKYVAPATGIYMIAVLSQFDNTTAAAATVEVELEAYINGSPAIGDFDGTPSPNGGRWSPSFTYMATLNAGDYVELFATISDGVGTGSVDLTAFRFSVWRVNG